MRKKPARLCAIIMVVFFILGIGTSALYSLVRYNAEKNLMCAHADERYTNFYLQTNTTDFKSNFLEINTSNIYNYIASVKEFPETENFINATFANFSNHIENGYIYFEQFKKSLSDEQYDKISNYLTSKPIFDSDTYYELVCTYYGFIGKQIIPLTVEVVETQENYVWYVQDKVIETFELVPDVKIESKKIRSSLGRKNVIDREFFLGNYSVDRMNSIIDKAKNDKENPQLYYLGDFEYAYRRIDNSYEPVDKNSVILLGDSVVLSGDYNVYTVTYIDTFNVMDNCIDDIKFAFASLILLFLAIGIVLSVTVYGYFKNELEKGRNLITITNSLAHNLKTPLFIISGNMETLDELTDNNEQKSYIDTALRQINIMDERIKKMFELSKIETTQYKLNYENLNLTELVTKTLQEYSQNEKEIIFESTEDVFVTADKTLIGSVLENLIDNAMRYGECESITIKLNDNTFSISNRCSYLTKKDIKRIFKPYYRHPKNGQKSGNGIGLNITQKILSLHKFKLRASIKNNIFTISFTVK